MHDHHCDHDEDVAISCRAQEEGEGERVNRDASVSADAAYEVLPLATLNAANLQGAQVWNSPKE